MLLGWNGPRAPEPRTGDRQAAPRLLQVVKAAALPAVAVMGLLAGVFCASIANHSSEKPQLAEIGRTVHGAGPEVHATFVAHRVDASR